MLPRWIAYIDGFQDMFGLFGVPIGLRIRIQVDLKCQYHESCTNVASMWPLAVHAVSILKRGTAAASFVV